MVKVSSILRVDNWISGTGAQNQIGETVNPRDTGACKFCLAGAIYACYIGDAEMFQLERVADYITEKYGVRGPNYMNVIIVFNDYHARWADIENIIKELEL